MECPQYRRVDAPLPQKYFPSKDRQCNLGVHYTANGFTENHRRRNRGRGGALGPHCFQSGAWPFTFAFSYYVANNVTGNFILILFFPFVLLCNIV